MSTALVCSGEITLQGLKSGITNVAFADSTAAVVPKCSTGWQLVEYVPPFDSSQIDPSVVAALIGAGFLLYLTPWAAAFGFSSLLKLLR